MPGIRPLKFVLLLIVLLAGACAAPAGAPPAATALPPTAVPPTVAPATAAPTAVPPTLSPTAVPPTPAPTPDLLAVVTALQAAYNQKDTDSIMALFVADPSWALTFGMFAFASSDSGTGYVAATTQNVRDLLDIGFEINSHLEASNCNMKNGGATCDLEITDDCKPPATSVYHVYTHFSFEDGMLTSVYGRWNDSDRTVFLPYDFARQEWARQNLLAEQTAYNEFSPDNIQGSRPPGLPEGVTASQFGQELERLCTGYAAAAQ